MTNYTVQTTFGSFRFAADLVQASATIYSLPDRDADDDGGFSTPFQTADARHSAERAALLLLRYFGRDYWLSPDADTDEDDDGTVTYNGMTEEEYLDSLILSVEPEPEPEPEYIDVRGVGGTLWTVNIVMTDGQEIGCHHPFHGWTLDYGEIDDDGEWAGNEDELDRLALEFARESRQGQELTIPDDIEIRR